MKEKLEKKYGVILVEARHGIVCIKDDVEICFSYTYEMLSECLIELFGY